MRVSSRRDTTRQSRSSQTIDVSGKWVATAPFPVAASASGAYWSRSRLPCGLWCGPVVTLVQLTISAVPVILFRYWSVFIVTACRSVLAYTASAFPIMSYLYGRRKRQDTHSAVTADNGSQHVIIVRDEDFGFDFVDLGTRVRTELSARVVKFILGIFWMLLLITSTGIKSHTWYLLAVGALGMAQNLFIAAVARHPGALGNHLELASSDDEDGHVPAIISEGKVMWTLMELEMRHPGFGKGLLDESFPGILRIWEVEWWQSKDIEEKRRRLAEEKEKASRLKAGREKVR